MSSNFSCKSLAFVSKFGTYSHWDFCSFLKAELLQLLQARWVLLLYSKPQVIPQILNWTEVSSFVDHFKAFKHVVLNNLNVVLTVWVIITLKAEILPQSQFSRTLKKVFLKTSPVFSAIYHFLNRDPFRRPGQTLSVTNVPNNIMLPSPSFTKEMVFLAWWGVGFFHYPAFKWWPMNFSIM